MFWYEDEVKNLEHKAQQTGADAETLFFGSSSIRLWTDLEHQFFDLKPINLGFGGSTLAACVWFFERIMASFNPKRLIVYAGDNDLGDGRHPEEVFIFFQQLMAQVKERFGDLPCYYISLKPSLNRWHIINSFKYTNYLIENEIIQNHPNWHFIDVFKSMLDTSGHPVNEYFQGDGLHLSKKGYEVWANVVRQQLESPLIVNV